VGDHVEPDQVLAKLDPQNELNALRSARAALSPAQGKPVRRAIRSSVVAFDFDERERPGLSRLGLAYLGRFAHAAYGLFGASRRPGLDAFNEFGPPQMKDGHRDSARSGKHVGKVPAELAVCTVVAVVREAERSAGVT